MEDDIDSLRELVEAMRELGIVEYHSGDRHIRLGDEPSPMVVRRTRDLAPLPADAAGAADARRVSTYRAIFGGEPPKFQPAVKPS